MPLLTEETDFVFPTEVLIEKNLDNGLNKNSKILCDSPFTWNKGIRFNKKLIVVDQEIILKVKKVWQIAFFNEKDR